MLYIIVISKIRFSRVKKFVLCVQFHVKKGIKRGKYMSISEIKINHLLSV